MGSTYIRKCPIWCWVFLHPMFIQPYRAFSIHMHLEQAVRIHWGTDILITEEGWKRTLDVHYISHAKFGDTCAHHTSHARMLRVGRNRARRNWKRRRVFLFCFRIGWFFNPLLPLLLFQLSRYHVSFYVCFYVRFHVFARVILCIFTGVFTCLFTCVF